MFEKYYVVTDDIKSSTWKKGHVYKHLNIQSSIPPYAYKPLNLYETQTYLRENFKYETFVYPLLGKKIEYDTYELVGYTFYIGKSDWMFMMYYSLDEKLYTNANEEDKECYDSFIKKYKTFEEALEGAIDWTLKNIEEDERRQNKEG